MLHALKQDSRPHENTMSIREPSAYKKAKHKLGAVKLGAVILIFICFGGLSAQFGLALASLLMAGTCALLIPPAIFLYRNKDRLEAKFMRRALNVQDPEESGEQVFETDFKFWATRDGLQMYVRSNYPRFHGQKYIRVIYSDVPNGILYEIKSHYFDEDRCAESLDLQVPPGDLMAKAWDKRLRQKIIENEKPDIEIAFNPSNFT
ncbi:hypothetical protein GF391_00810 [Candidatus Uhrbacteria bacterium]|nr:hypothetical protein [Candidatus Uhrbacteria bacterium]